MNQAFITIRSKRNTYIIRSQNKRKSSLNLVAKLQCKLTSVAGRYNSLTLQVSRFSRLADLEREKMITKCLLSHFDSGERLN